MTAVNSATGNQVTQYIYGSTLAASGIASSLLKVNEIYPDSVGGSDQVTFTYNRQGEITTVTDQNGTVHSYNYDLLGRTTQDRVTTVGTGIDTTVLRIASTYEVRGMVTGVTSYDNATVGSGSVVNDVQLVYNSFAQLITDYQSHSGAVNMATTPVVQYGYANGSANTIRPTTMTYPNGRVLNFNYGTASGTNDALSRIGSLIDNDGVTHLADYSYLGMAGIIQQNEPQPGLTYTLIGIAGGNDPVTGDIYQGLDLFGRIKDLIWTCSSGNSSSSSSSSSGAANIVERIQHGYDRAGNRLWRKELADPSQTHDEHYDCDGLYRLKDTQRGTLTSNQTAISPMTFAQCWGLDSTGNWQDFREDETGNGVWNLIQARSANKVNEISAVTNTVGAAWVTPAYDAAGNMTTIPQPATPGSGYTGTYDAWNRLMTLSASGSQVAGNKYDGLKRRTVKQTYSSSVLSETRDLYYSQAWQVLEERINGATTPDRQFMWGSRYIDDIVLRDRDPNGIGTLTERLYAFQDPNWNVTGVADFWGTVQERYGYHPYGVPSVLTAIFVLRAGTLWDWDVRYAGYMWDRESGLYQVRERYLQATLGSFSSRDTLSKVIGLERVLTQPDIWLITLWNLYFYVSDAPLLYTDPTGQQPHAQPLPCPPASRVRRPCAGLPEPDGCTGVPNTTLDGTNFRPACDAHDICYSACGADKDDCDTAFFLAMVAACNARYPARQGIAYRTCMATARTYAAGVRQLGQPFFDDAQAQFCMCDTGGLL